MKIIDFANVLYDKTLDSADEDLLMGIDNLIGIFKCIVKNVNTL